MHQNFQMQTFQSVLHCFQSASFDSDEQATIRFFFEIWNPLARFNSCVKIVEQESKSVLNFQMNFFKSLPWQRLTEKKLFKGMNSQNFNSKAIR